MSKRNGDKARFGKERKKKEIRRKHTLEVRQSLANSVSAEAPKPAPAASPAAAPIQTDLG